MARNTFFTIDGHTAGNPVRLVVGGAPPLDGKSMNEKRLFFMKNYDWIRKGLMFEPRGHDMMSGSILYQPANPENDIGVVFIETSGCLPMCGHGTIGTITFGIEEGLIQPKIPGKVKMEAPAGLIDIEYEMDGRKVKSVKLTNVKSYAAKMDIEVESKFLGKLNVDVCYGGNFYAIIDPQENYPGIEHFKAEQLVQYSREIRELIRNDHDFIHPENPSIKKLSHVMWTGKPLDKDATSRNAVFFGEKAIDRSPCGTGTSARLAQLHKKGKLQKGEPFIHESFIGSKFIGKIEEVTHINGMDAIIPSITGWAVKTGFNTIIIDDEEDPYAHGFEVI